MHSFGNFSYSQNFRNMWCHISVIVIESACSASRGMPSGPGMSGLSTNVSLLRISLKCSFHLDRSSTFLWFFLRCLSLVLKDSVFSTLVFLTGSITHPGLN